MLVLGQWPLLVTPQSNSRQPGAWCRLPSCWWTALYGLVIIYIFGVNGFPVVVCCSSSGTVRVKAWQPPHGRKQIGEIHEVINHRLLISPSTPAHLGYFWHQISSVSPLRSLIPLPVQCRQTCKQHQLTEDLKARHILWQIDRLWLSQFPDFSHLSVMVCGLWKYLYITAPPHPIGWRWCFQSWNRRW